ncbi:MAG: M1 family aminopeptidase [Burkholderiaceae bacterium]
MDLRRHLAACLVALSGAFVPGSVLPATKAPAVTKAAIPVPAGRLPRNVMPTHVVLALTVDPREERFSGKVQIDVRVTRPTRTVWLHGSELRIVRATLTPQGGAPRPLAVTSADASGVLRLDLARRMAAGRARIEIAFDAPFGQLQGAYKARAADEDYVLTQMEALGARHAFPAFDEPSFKQPWDIRLTIPEAMQGAANTRLLRTLPAAPGWKELVFATTLPLPSYLIAFAVGPWDVVDAEPLPPNAVRARPVALRGIAPRGQGPRMRYMLGSTAEIVAALEAYFGIAYPFDKLDLLAAPDFGNGAMENPGLIVYRDRLLYADEHSDLPLRYASYAVHAHELAHQWFGDLVTMPWWDDVWLNESFATWMSAKVVGTLQPDRRPELYQQGRTLAAMEQDSLAATRRIREPIRASTDVASAFDRITYAKGAAVLSMFERYLGEDRFRNGIRAYLHRHARGNATSADLVASLAARSDDPAALRAAIGSFLDQPGVPMLQVALDCPQGAAPRLRIVQSRFLPVGSAASSAGAWRVPVCVRWGDAQGGGGSQCSLVGASSNVLALKAPSCPAWVMPNAGGAGYYRFALGAEDAAALEANFDRLDEREQRAYADSIDAAFSAGVIDVPRFLRASTRLAAAPALETALAPAETIEWMLLHLDPTPAQEASLRGLLRRLYAPRLAALGSVPRPGETETDALFRLRLMHVLARAGRDPELRATLALQGRRMLGLPIAADAAPGDGRLHLDAAAAEVRGLALVVALQQDGAADVFEALMTQLAASTDANLRGDLLAALNAAREPPQQARLRALVLVPDALRRNEIPLLLRREKDGDRAARPAIREWIVEHFDSVAARVAPFAVRVVRAYADDMCSEPEADALQERFGSRVAALDGGPRALAQTIEEVRLCAALRERQRIDIGVDLP